MKKNKLIFLGVFFLMAFVPGLAADDSSDLYIDGRINIHPGFPKIGENVTISAAIKSAGIHSPCPLKVRLIITGPVGFHKVDRIFDLPCHLIEMGEQRIYDFSHTGIFTQMGVYKAVLKIDINHQLAEDDESNNEKSRFFRADPLPDLALYVPFVKPVDIGHKRTVKVEVKNIGPGMSPQTRLRFYLDAEGWKWYDIPPLRQNDMVTFSRSHRWYVPGKKKYEMCVDCGKNIRELREDNNVIEGWVDVNVVGSGSLDSETNPCDLHILFSKPNRVKINETIAIVARIKNRSSHAKSPPAMMDFRVDGHRTVSFHIPELFPNQSHEIPYSAKWSTPGSKLFGARITSGNGCQWATASIVVEGTGFPIHKKGF